MMQELEEKQQAEEAAKELGMVFEVDARFHHVARMVLPDGRVKYIRDAYIDINGSGAAEVARDKDYAAYFLKKSGFPVPRGEAFFTPEWAKTIGSTRTPERAWRYAQRIGLPVFVKPNSKMQGKGVSRVANKVDFFMAVHRASANERTFLVQQPVHGKEFRVVVVNGEVVIAYQKTHPHIIGDGKLSVHDVIKKTHKSFLSPDGAGVRDGRIEEMLREQHLTLESVLESGRRVQLLPTANVSTGGSARNVTHLVHPQWCQIAVGIARAMNLRYIGIDLIAEKDLSQKPSDYTVLEVNSAPGLEYFALLGPKQMTIVKNVYKEILSTLQQM
jgi:D-alanine-D-alanine ligase-like ATP-grasp enzyme